MGCTNFNRCTQRLVIMHAQTLMNPDCTQKTSSVRIFFETHCILRLSAVWPHAIRVYKFYLYTFHAIRQPVARQLQPFAAAKIC